MSLKTCATCGTKFEGGFLENQCTACRRQAPITNALRQQADAASAAAQAQQEVAAAQAHAALTEAHAIAQLANAQAEAARTEAAARAMQAEMDAKAAYAEKIASMDDDALDRLHLDEQRKADRARLDAVLELVGAAAACIELNGAPTAQVNARAYAEENSDGVVTAFRWHNLKVCERMLLKAREDLLAISDMPAGANRADLQERIEKALASCRHGRPAVAREAVDEVRRRRALLGAGGGVGGAVVIAVGGILRATGSPVVPFLVLALGGIITSLAVLGAWEKSGAIPLEWDDMVREAGALSEQPAKLIKIGGAVASVVLLVGVAAWMVEPTEKEVNKEPEPPRTPLAGDYSRDGHSLKIEPGWMILDGKDKLPLGGAKVDGPKASFVDQVLTKGLISDDTCSGELLRKDDKLLVTVQSGSHRDCSIFAGEWQVGLAAARRAAGRQPAGAGGSASEVEMPPEVRGTWSLASSDDCMNIKLQLTARKASFAGTSKPGKERSCSKTVTLRQIDVDLPIITAKEEGLFSDDFSFTVGEKGTLVVDARQFSGTYKKAP